MIIDSFRSSLGVSSGVITVNKFGENPAVATNESPEDVWDAGGVYSFVSSAQVLQAVSSSADDDADPPGTGAHSVRVFGLDSDWALIGEDVDLNGTTAVETSLQFLRVFSAHVTAAGADETNAGNITITYKTAGSTAAQIRAGNSQALMAIYTIPVGYSGLMVGMYASIASSFSNPAGSRGDVHLLIKENADSGTPAWRVNHVESIVIDGTSRMEKAWFPYKRYSSKTDIKIQVAAVSVGSEDTNISAGFDLFLINNNTINSWF